MIKTKIKKEKYNESKPNLLNYAANKFKYYTKNLIIKAFIRNKKFCYYFFIKFGHENIEHFSFTEKVEKLMIIISNL